MNKVELIGRLTRDPEIGETQTGTASCRFSLAIDRPKKPDGAHDTDFPRIITFGKHAENAGRFLAKGMMVGVVGRIQTGSYTTQQGDKVYTTDVFAEYIEYLEWRDDKRQDQGYRDDRGGYHGGGQYQPKGQGYQDQSQQQSFGGYEPSMGQGNYRR